MSCIFHHPIRSTSDDIIAETECCFIVSSIHTLYKIVVHQLRFPKILPDDNVCIVNSALRHFSSLPLAVLKTDFVLEAAVASLLVGYFYAAAF